MKKLITRSCEEIMTTVYKPIEFVIDELVAQGLYILAGAPKVGKSWLALDMCLSIAKGESVLGQKTSFFATSEKKVYRFFACDSPANDFKRLASVKVSFTLLFMVFPFLYEKKKLQVTGLLATS